MYGMGVVDKKILEWMMEKCSKDRIITANVMEIAGGIGYKKSGGTITYSLKLLRASNKIIKIGKNTYKVTV